MLSVTLKQIEYATAIYDHGGVTAAAEALNISQPALSAAIAQLEAELGRPLFIRRQGQRIAVTSFGRSFMQDGRQLIDRAQALIDTAREEATTTGLVVIGCFEDLAPNYLAGILKGFRQAYPDIAVKVRDVDFVTLADELDGGTIDVALTYDLGLNFGVERHILKTVKPHVLVSADHRLAHEGSVSMEQLVDDPLILVDQDLSWQHIVELFRANNLEPTVGMRVGTFELLRSFVGNGLGISVSYTRPTGDLSYDGSMLRRLEIADDIPLQRIILAYPKANPPTAVARALIDFIAESFASP